MSFFPFCPGQVLRLKVMDKDMLKDDTIGEVIINITDKEVSPSGETGVAMKDTQQAFYSILDEKNNNTGSIQISLSFALSASPLSIV